jgi:hypothetical protein
MTHKRRKTKLDFTFFNADFELGRFCVHYFCLKDLEVVEISCTYAFLTNNRTKSPQTTEQNHHKQPNKITTNNRKIVKTFG